MNFKSKLNIIYNLMFNTIIFGYFCFLAIFILLITFYFLELPTIDNVSMLKYSEVLVTLILVGVTAKYAYDNNKMVKQTKGTQNIYYIQERLEKYYYPLLNIMPTIVTSKEDTLNKESLKYSPISNLEQHTVIMSELNNLVKYQYLAFQETKMSFENFMKIMNNYKYGRGVTDDQIISSRTKLTTCIKNDIGRLESELNNVFN